MTHSLYYQPSGHWFGDCMPYAENGVFSLFHQRDTRKPGPFGEPFGWALARTSDFVTYEDLGEVVSGGGDDAQDQFIFAGSVFKAAGTYYALYTGYNRDYPEQGKPSQVLMIATSPDLVNWTKTNRKLVVPQPGYDPDDWRDPFVLWDDAVDAWRMILGARMIDGEQIVTGRTVSFTSTDLEEWSFDGDFYAPNLYSMHEMPDVFKMGDWWYLLTTEYSDKSKTVYAMSRSLSGPWVVPDDDAFDGRAYYAARSAADGGHRFLFGWVPTKESDDERKPWEWGGTLVVHEIVQRTDGTLGVRPPQTVVNAFNGDAQLAGTKIESTDAVVAARLADETGELFRFDVDVSVTPGTKSFSLRLFEDETTGDGYEFLFDVAGSRLSFDRRPNYPWYRYDNKGLDRPLELKPDIEHRITLIVDDTIATLYIDDIALNARVYNRPGHSIVASVFRGCLRVSRAAISRGLSVRSVN